MARLTKLGKLVDKMLDNPEGWTLYGPSKDLIKHNASNWALKVTTEEFFDFPNFKAFSKADQAALFPKARALKDELAKVNALDKYKTERSVRYRNRKYIYNNIISTVMGLK